MSGPGATWTGYGNSSVFGFPKWHLLLLQHREERGLRLPCADDGSATPGAGYHRDGGPDPSANMPEL